MTCPVLWRERVEVHDAIMAEVERRVDRIQQDIYGGVYTGIFNFLQDSQVCGSASSRQKRPSKQGKRYPKKFSEWIDWSIRCYLWGAGWFFSSFKPLWRPNIKNVAFIDEKVRFFLIVSFWAWSGSGLKLLATWNCPCALFALVNTSFLHSSLIWVLVLGLV